MRAWYLLALGLLGCAARAPADIGKAQQSNPVRVPPIPAKLGDHEPPYVLPCKEGSELDEALHELKSVDAAIDRLPVDADPQPLAQKVESLYRRRCFDIGEVELDAEHVDSVLSLREFWQDARTQLFTRLGWGKNEERFLWIVPPIQHALALDVTPQHPLRSLLCPSNPKACGIETAGWALRANRALRRRAELRDGQLPRASPRTPCTGAMSFVTFSQCIRQSSFEHETLPLGRLRAPTDGWLLLRGPQKDNCSQLRAYDLATGSAWTARSCSGDASAESGHLPIAELQEAAWMIFFARTIDRVVDGFRREIPPEMVIASPGPRVHEAGTARVTKSNHRLVWQWVRGKSTVAIGTLDTAAGFDAEYHTEELLEIAEASFVKGPAGLPAALPWNERTSTTLRVGALEDLPEESDFPYRELEQELSRAMAQRGKRP